MNDMMGMVMGFDGMSKGIKHIPGPEGVRGRNSENKLILEKLGWEPTIRLEVRGRQRGRGAGAGAGERVLVSADSCTCVSQRLAGGLGDKPPLQCSPLPRKPRRPSSHPPASTLLVPPRAPRCRMGCA
jgi:hypothetical protein